MVQVVDILECWPISVQHNKQNPTFLGGKFERMECNYLAELSYERNQKSKHAL